MAAVQIELSNRFKARKSLARVSKNLATLHNYSHRSNQPPQWCLWAQRASLAWLSSAKPSQAEPNHQIHIARLCIFESQHKTTCWDSESYNGKLVIETTIETYGSINYNGLVIYSTFIKVAIWKVTGDFKDDKQIFSCDCYDEYVYKYRQWMGLSRGLSFMSHCRLWSLSRIKAGTLTVPVCLFSCCCCCCDKHFEII